MRARRKHFFLCAQIPDMQHPAARANRLPAITLSARARYGESDLDALFDTWLLNLSANLSAPLLDGGYRKAEVDRTRAVMDQRLAAYRDTVIRAVKEVEDALVRVPFNYRTAVVLHDVEDWKVREIAELQGISLPAAKQRLRRGRMMLVDALAEGHERRTMLKEVPMRCWDARKHVSDYLDGALEQDTALMVESHLEACPTCPPLYAALVGAHSGLAAHRDPDSVIPPDVRARILTLR